MEDGEGDVKWEGACVLGLGGVHGAGGLSDSAFERFKRGRRDVNAEDDLSFGGEMRWFNRIRFAPLQVGIANGSFHRHLSNRRMVLGIESVTDGDVIRILAA